MDGPHLARLRHGPSRAGTPMMRPRFRMSAAMVDAIGAAAARKGLTAPAWLRAIVANHLGMPEQADRQPVRAYGGDGPDAAALTALRMQLHELGGLLVQLAKVARLDGEAARHADAEHTLAEVREAIGTVARWQRERGTAA